MASKYPKIDTISDLIKKYHFDDFTIDDSEVKQLVKLKFHNEPLLTLKDREFLYDALGLINEIGYDEAYSLFKEKNDFEDKREIIRKSSPYVNARRQYFLEITSAIRAKNNIVDSIYACKKCGSRKVVVKVQVTRRADEDVSEFKTCMSCKFSWKD